jgi:hypothetical protein
MARLTVLMQEVLRVVERQLIGLGTRMGDDYGREVSPAHATSLPVASLDDRWSSGGPAEDTADDSRSLARET